MCVGVRCWSCSPEGMGQAHIPTCAPPWHSALLIQLLQKQSPTSSRPCPAISAALLALHTSSSHLCVCAGDPSRPAKPPAPGRLPTLRAIPESAPAPLPNPPIAVARGRLPALPHPQPARWRSLLRLLRRLGPRRARATPPAGHELVAIVVRRRRCAGDVTRCRWLPAHSNGFPKSWPMAYGAPCGGSGRYARPAVPWLARGTCR